MYEDAMFPRPIDNLSVHIVELSLPVRQILIPLAYVILTICKENGTTTSFLAILEGTSIVQPAPLQLIHVLEVKTAVDLLRLNIVENTVSVILILSPVPLVQWISTLFLIEDAESFILAVYRIALVEIPVRHRYLLVFLQYD